MFARKWVAYGYTLDLVECTLTGSGYSGFEVVSMEGEGESAVISCKTGSKTYTLTLNDGGALELKDGDAVELTFLAANPFAGAWAPDDPYSYTYYMFSPEIGADGTFAWDQYAYGTNESLESDGTATTVFSIGESGAEISLNLLTYGMEAGTVTLIDGVAHFDDGYGWMVYDLLPYTNNVKEGSYLNVAGNVFTYQEGKFAIDGKVVDTTPKASAYGSGLSFTADGKDYLFQVGPEGEYIVTDDSLEKAYAYQTDLLLGEWSDNDGNTLVFQNGEEVKYNGVAYPLSPSVQYGEIVIGFSAGTSKYELRFTDVEAALAFSDNYGVSNTFVRDDLKQEYVGGYTNVLCGFEVGEDYAMTNLVEGDELFPASEKGSFEYLTEEDLPDFGEEFAAVTYCFGDYAMFCIPTDYCAPFFCFKKNESGVYEYHSILFAESDLPDIIEMFNAGLESENDVFTTGGTAPETLTIDFEAGTVKITATGSEPVSENFFLDVSAIGLPALCFLSGEDDDLILHTVELSAMGLFDTAVSLNTLEEVDAKSYISREQYEKLLGMSFVYHGPYYDEVIEIAEDGTLSISTTDYTESDNAVTLVKYPYQLSRYSLLDGSDTIGLAFGVDGLTLNLLVNIYNLQYATVMDVEYCRTELSEFVGVYEADGKTVELTVRATVLVDGAEVALTSPVTVTEGKATATYTADGTSYTVEFTAESATLGGTTYTKNTNVFAFDKFVGVYTVGEHEVEVKATTIGINIPLSIVATVDGTDATYETSVTAGQVLSLSVLDFMTFDMITITLTLKDGKIVVSDGTNSSTSDAADWDFAKFSSQKEFTLTDSEGAEHKLICLPKKSGKAPLFFYDDLETMCTEYIVAKSADGTYTLTLSAGFETVVITCNADGTLTANYPESD